MRVDASNPVTRSTQIQGLTSEGVDGIKIDWSRSLPTAAGFGILPMTEDQRWHSAYAGLLRKAVGISTERVAEVISVRCRGDIVRVHANVEMRRIWMLRQLSNTTMIRHAEHTAWDLQLPFSFYNVQQSIRIGYTISGVSPT
jgi:hypothetical protein